MRFPLVLASLLLATPLVAQSAPAEPPEIPGSMDTTKITGGTYDADPAHTLIGFRVNHFGFSDYFGIFGDVSGTLMLDKNAPEKSSVNITIPVAKVTTASKKLTEHLKSEDFFNTENNGPATFISTKVTVDGTDAEITGNLTINGVTKPVLLKGEFTGAGINPFNKKETVGFKATTAIKRSDFGISYGLPVVSDEVYLGITAAFEKQTAP